MGLSDELIRLEQQAAQVASYLHDADEETLQLIADGWAPLADSTKGRPPAQLARWRRDWVGWLMECAERYEARPTEPSADELHQILMRWATGTPRLRRHKTGHG
jgi:hypothetical protein